MKALSRAIFSVSLFCLLASLPAAAQQKPAQDADLLRTKIEQFEKTDISSKSASVQSIYQRTLLRLYNEFNASLAQDIAELKAMQSVLMGTTTESQNEIAQQIKKLTQEREETLEKLQTLKGDLRSTALGESPAVPQPAAEPEPAQPETMNVTYASPGNAQRQRAVAVPLSDSLSAAATTTPPTSPKNTFVYDESLSWKKRCQSKRDFEKANAGDQASLDTISAKARLSCPNSGLIGLLLGGVVVSQQEKNFSQADPFFGFIAGYNTDSGAGGWAGHFRVQGIFQVQPQKASAPPATTTASPSPTPTPTATPTPVDPSNFVPFLASRKTFDIDLHFWADRPFGRGVLRIGPYIGIGASTYIDKNELKGDETVTKDDSSGGAGTKLDPSLGRASNDLKRYIEGGVIAHFLKDSGELFMQTQLLYGKYEALEGLYPGHDTRQRFIGRLRIFPTGLKLAMSDPNKESGLDMSPMFGVELNAGRGPDQLKFFTGIAISITRFKPFAKEPEKPATTPTPTPSGGGNGNTGLQ